MKYGDLPKFIGVIDLEPIEMFFYQYLPIKLPFSFNFHYEERLSILDNLVFEAIEDFQGDFGIDAYNEHYVYLTAKHLYVKPNKVFNRGGYHSDGFMTDDINYIWSNINPTVFNKSRFDLTMDDRVSMKEMNSQALSKNEVIYPNSSLLRLNQFNIHKVNENIETGMRLFVKISFSKDKYDLKGNSKNYFLDYDWEMRSRGIERNIPQLIKATNNE